MEEKLFFNAVTTAYKEGRRLVAPLLGFPGLNLTGSTIKLAQQNYGEHFKVVRMINETFKPDAVFPLMDLSVEVNALGRYTVFPKHDSATVPKDEFNLDDFAQIKGINISYDTRLIGYVETLKRMHKELSPSVFRGAYVTGPYTLASLLMGAEEAAESTLLNRERLHMICSLVTGKVVDYIEMLVESGAQLICILEPSAVMLGPDQFEEFSAHYVRNIIEAFKENYISIIYHICGNTMHLVEKMSKTGVDALSLDSQDAGVDLKRVVERIPENVIIIGNINPIGTILKGNPSDVKKEVYQLLKTMELYPNFVLSTGCDLPQMTPLENIHAFMEAGRSYRFN